MYIHKYLGFIIPIISYILQYTNSCRVKFSAWKIPFSWEEIFLIQARAPQERNSITNMHMYTLCKFSLALKGTKARDSRSLFFFFLHKWTPFEPSSHTLILFELGDPIREDIRKKTWISIVSDSADSILRLCYSTLGDIFFVKEKVSFNNACFGSLLSYIHIYCISALSVGISSIRTPLMFDTVYLIALALYHAALIRHQYCLRYRW